VDATPIADLESFEFEIDFNDADAVAEAIEELESLQQGCEDAKSAAESVAELAEEAAQGLEEVLEALREIEGLLEPEAIEVGQVVQEAITLNGTQPQSFRVLAVEDQKWAWLRDVNEPKAKPVTASWDELEIIEEA
jgi:hypothetical protein